MSLYSDVRYKVNYARGVAACCADMLPMCESNHHKAQIVWTLLRFTMQRVLSRKTPEEYDAAQAIQCPCEDDMPTDLRCQACPRRLFGETK